MCEGWWLNRIGKLIRWCILTHLRAQIDTYKYADTHTHTFTQVHMHTNTYIHKRVILQIADLCQPPGVGDKKILRTLAFNLGLVKTSSVVKRAIQFGTRVAKHTNVMYHGSNRKGKGDTRIWCHIIHWFLSRLLFVVFSYSTCITRLLNIALFVPHSCLARILLV